MKIEQLKTKTINSAIWKFLERIAAQVVSFVVSVILARLLTPDDYSIVGIVAIFFAFAETIISGGFNAALIQKKDADEEDYSSVFTINILASTAMYLILFFCAPFIANLYEKDLLVPIFRVMGLTLFINAFKSIVSAYVSKQLQFRKYFLATMVGTIVSAVIGISMAIKGFGPWALVAQSMTNAVVGTIVLFATVKVRFRFKLYKTKAKGLFQYGWKIWVTSGISVLYDEINPLVVGLKYSGADLSFYSKGKSFPGLFNSTIGGTLSSVLLPSMVQVQDDPEKLLNYVRRFIGICTFCIFPMMIGLMAVSDTFILLLLTEKWLPASIYLQAFCIVYMFDMIQTGNLQVIKALGRSDITLILEILKKSLYFIVILSFILFTNRPEYLALACVINTLIATSINTFPNRKLIGYQYRLQLLDVLPNLITALLMGVVVFGLGILEIHPLLLLTVQVLGGAGTYLILNLIIRNQNLNYIWNIAIGFLRKNKMKVKVNESNKKAD